MKPTTRTLFALLAAFACWSEPRGYAIPTIDLQVSDSDIQVGETFDMTVWARGALVDDEELIAFGFDVTTPGLLSYDGFAAGPGWDALVGAASYVGATALPGFIVSDVLLATLHFTALSAGNGTLDVNGPYDGFDYGLFYSLSGFDILGTANIVVTPSVAPVPDSSSLAVTMVTWLGLLGFARRSGTLRR